MRLAAEKLKVHGKRGWMRIIILKGSEAGPRVMKIKYKQLNHRKVKLSQKEENFNGFSPRPKGGNI
jgi:hypothetical protein